MGSANVAMANEMYLLSNVNILSALFIGSKCCTNWVLIKCARSDFAKFSGFTFSRLLRIEPNGTSEEGDAPLCIGTLVPL